MIGYGMCKRCGEKLTRHYQTWSGYCDSCIEKIPKDWSVLDRLHQKSDTPLMSKSELRLLKAKGESMRLGIPLNDVLDLMGDK